MDRFDHSAIDLFMLYAIQRKHGGGGGAWIRRLSGRKIALKAFYPSIMLETAVEIRLEWVTFFKSQMVTVIDDFTSLVWCGAVQKARRGEFESVTS